MNTLTIPDFPAVAAALAALGVTADVLLCCRDCVPERQGGFAVPDRIVASRHRWIYFERYGDGNWNVCTGGYPGPGTRTLLDIADVTDPHAVAEQMKAAIDRVGSDA